MAFLQSDLGQFIRLGILFHKIEHKTLRVVTDMNRYNEESPNDAGARFLSKIHEMGFDV